MYEQVCMRAQIGEMPLAVWVTFLQSASDSLGLTRECT